MVLTNLVGMAVTATVLSASDVGVTLAYDEDGATNVMAWTKLATNSQDAVCAMTGFAPMPPELEAVYRRVRVDMRRVENLLAAGRMTQEEADARKSRIRFAFAAACREKGVSPMRQGLLLRRLEGIGR